MINVNAATPPNKNIIFQLDKFRIQSAVFVGFYCIRIFPFTRYVNICGTTHSDRFVRSDLVVLCTPFLKVLICVGKVKESVSFKKLALQRAVKSLDLALRLRVQGATVDRKYIQIHQPTFKECITTFKARKCTAIVG